jgi:hypothetical protein
VAGREQQADFLTTCCCLAQPSILRDRHLDHVMACCIFGMARVSDFNVQFKEIINKYKEVRALVQGQSPPRRPPC